MNAFPEPLFEALNYATEVERLSLRSLISHSAAVQGDQKLAEVYRSFQNHQHEFVAVLEGGSVLGLCSRGRISFLLGARYGFPIHSEKPIRNYVHERLLQVPEFMALREVFQAALSRKPEDFYDDVLLLDDRGSFVGLIAVDTLVRLQSRLVAEQLLHLEAQQKALRSKNNELFCSLSELRQSQARYAILFENHSLGVVLLNPQGQLGLHNQRLDALLGLSDADFSAGANILEWVQPAEREDFARLLTAHESEGTCLPEQCREFTLHLPDRGPRLFKIFTKWIRETGQICACLDDITEQRALERRLAQKEKQALLESLVGGISHELNNNLTPILGYSELLQNAAASMPDSAVIINYVRSIKEGASQSAHIVRQLLQLSKPFDAEPTACDLCAIIRDALSVAKFKVREGDCSIDLELPDTPIPVLADATQIKQVILNLVFNAVDATQNCNRREIRVIAITAAQNVYLLVKDTGQGIKPENLPRIFDPFYTTKGPDRGTGLGLSVCLSLVKQHGGEITVASALGRGTAFRVALPLSQLPIDSKPGIILTAPNAFLSRERIRALVVDDEPCICGLVQEILRTDLGLQVETAAHGQEAIHRLEQSPFDLVISDVRMPVMNGMALFRWLQHHHPQLVRKFLFITGDEGNISVAREIEALDVPLMRKPFSPRSLVQECDRLLRVS